jgi:CubicO group peptidase (beta-lactamase class C family)
MMWAKSLALLAGATPFARAAVNPCPLDGPVFPKPAQLSQMPIIKAAVANLTETFTNWNANDTSTNAFSYSIQIFSAWEDDPIWSFNHTAPNLANITHPGVTTVDQDSVYRLGSLTKIFTVYNFLLNAGDTIWTQPITNYIPELAAIANRSSEDQVEYTAWNDITIGSLATQLAGIPRDCTSALRLLETR